MKHIVCIGSSAASISCAAQIKRLDKNIQVTILTAQSEMPNNTCLLADYVAGKRTKESIYLSIPEGINIHYTSEVVAIDALSKTVLTKNGQEYQYDKLFIGVGLRARVLDIFVPELNKKVFLFKSLDDIVRFDALFSGKNILVVGGGVTGIEACHALKMRGYNITLVEKNARLLPIFDEELAQKIRELLEMHDVKVHLNYRITQEVLHEFDGIFLATGGVPATDFLHGQIELESEFIVVDEYQCTSDKNIFAGGDVCKGRVLWPQAVRDGVVAAYGLLNARRPYFKLINYKTIIKVFGESYVCHHINNL